MSIEGIFVINKEKNWTSNDVVQKIKGITKGKKVGHAGTLDPLATGVLVIAIGKKFTKQLTEMIKKEKEYIVEITLGQSSVTDDEEGEKTIWEIHHIPKQEEIQQIVKKYIGDIQQIPPVYSAIKVKGKKAYQMARKGKEVQLEARPVHIFDIQIQAYIWPKLVLYVKTGSGVYIRSLARDVGKDLGVGGYVSALDRISVGSFTKNQAVTIQEFQQKMQNP